MRKREGIEPRYERLIVGADVLSITEGSYQQPMAMAPANPSGSKTGARHHGKVGNSADPMDPSKEGERVWCLNWRSEVWL